MFRGLTRMTGHAIAGIVCVAILAVVAIVVFDGVERVTAPFRDGGDPEQEQEQRDARISVPRYEELVDLCRAAQNAEGRISSLEEELAGDPAGSRVTQINASLTALRSSRSDSINEYNTLARQETRAAFAEAGLPSRLDHDTQETQCAA